MKINCIKFGIVSIGVNEITNRTIQTSNKQKKPGNKAVNELLTAGGTLNCNVLVNHPNVKVS